MYQFSAGIDRLDANSDERGAWTLTYLPDLGGGAFDLRKREDDRGRQWAERRDTSYLWRWNGNSFAEHTSQARRRRHSR
jgi:hypothetical protein